MLSVSNISFMVLLLLRVPLLLRRATGEARPCALPAQARAQRPPASAARAERPRDDDDDDGGDAADDDGGN